MNAKRILGIVCAGILASSLSGLVACSANTDKEVPTSQAVQAATVSITMVDAKGNKVQGSGVLIAPRLVLTSGHLISGMSKWSVTNGKTTVTGSRGHTYDWLAYTDKKAHPRKHDVGVITLDEAIKLDAYPRIVASKSSDGTKATRVRGTGGGAFEMKDTVLGRVNTSPNAYLADIGGETLDTGGAVFDDRGIIGIVSGKGATTGKLYIARTDRLTQWLSPKVSCAGGSLQTRTYAEAQKDKSAAVCEDDAKNANNPGGNNGGNTATVPGNGPSANGPLGGGESCAAAEINGYCSGNCVGIFPGGANVPGANGGPSAATNESNGANPNPNNGGAGSGSSANGANGGSNTGSSANNGESNGANPSGGANTGSSANNGESNGANPNGGAAGGGSVNAGSTESNGAQGGGGAGAGSVSNTPGSGLEGEADENCQGAGDNPDVCPFDGDLTTFGLNPNQGGGRPDWDIDYTIPVYGGSSGGTSGGDGLKVN